MTWQEIREAYPHRWVLVEAIDACTENGRRIVKTMSLIRPFAEDWYAAWAEYRRLHDLNKMREYYILHTDREELNIRVMDYRGRTLLNEP